jgi:hypothetical protein
MEETETTDMAEEHVRSRMPEEVVESLIMSMAVNMEWPPLTDASEEEEEEEDDEVPLEEPLHVTEATKELLRRLDERHAALEKELAARMERSTCWRPRPVSARSCAPRDTSSSTRLR